MNTATAILEAFISPNVSDSNGEPANIVDAVASVGSATWAAARAITPSAAPGTDACGGTVASLTEAVMGVTAGLVAIAEAIRELAEVQREAQSR